jgi:hypothetical protein
MVSGFSLIFRLIFKQVFPMENPLVTSSIIFILAVALDPFRKNLLEVMIAFFRRQRIYDKRARFRHQMTSALDIQNVGRILRQQITDTLAPEYTISTLTISQ